MRYVVVALLLVGALSGVAVAQEAPDIANATTAFDVELRADGGADWTVRTVVPLDTAEERDAFRSYGERFAAGETTAGPGIEFFESAAASASTAAGREMQITNTERDYSLGADTGTLRLEFRWTNFLREGANETLVLDDAFTLPTAESDERRTWLSIFDADQEILIRPPDGYTVTGTSIAVQQRESAIVLAEPSDFEGAEAELRVTYSPVGPADQLPIGILASGAIVALAVLAAVWLMRNRSDGAGLSEGSPSSGDGGTPAEGAGSDGGSDVSPAGSDTGDPDDSAETARTPSGAERPAPAGADVSGNGAAGEEADLSLLSDEERVERLLERNGGRMKQATIVDETDWSDAKVSQLLSAMAEEGRVDKLRLGRENLISLPDDAQDRDEETRDGENRDQDGSGQGS